jgi:hypothetical protein
VQGVTDDQIKAMPAFDRNSRGFRELEGNATVQVNTIR